MKLLRYGERGLEKPGMLDSENVIRDLSGHIDDIAGDALSDESLARLRAIDPGSLPVVSSDVRIGACVGNVGKMICIGLNYADHAAEAGMDVPPEPILFSKATSAICGPYDELEIPRGAEKCDWEVELGVVIGKQAKYVEEADALDYVAGYCTVNDVSERDFQAKRKGQWVKGKSHDTFGPIGPWFVSRDDVPDPQNMPLTMDVDSHRYQNGSTATMVYGVTFLVAYISQFMSLQPGDIIATGTPPGVGMGIKPEPVFLRPGQTVCAEVHGLGAQRLQTVQA